MATAVERTVVVRFDPDQTARVLTEEQNDELWELFCSYGRLRWESEAAFGSHNLDESGRLRREADDVQERFGEMLHSLTALPS